MTYILPLLWITSCKPKYGTTLILEEVRPYRLKKTKSPLIASLASMEVWGTGWDIKRSAPDCSAKEFWEIVGRGRAIVPKLIRSLTDPTPTNVESPCKEEPLTVGELAYLALDEIIELRATILYLPQVCIIDGVRDPLTGEMAQCDPMLNDFFTDWKKDIFQLNVKGYYRASNFIYTQYPEDKLTQCQIENSIDGYWKYDDNGPYFSKIWVIDLMPQE